MPLLEVSSVDAYYGNLQALSGVSLQLEAGEIVALVGAAGAGKSTLLQSIVGRVPCRSGTIRLRAQALGLRRAEQIKRLGIALVPQGRGLFPSLTVAENLLMGEVTGRCGPWSLAKVYELFPDLQRLRETVATRLSGGQLRMVAIGRALMANPQVLLCDEISPGLAPDIVSQVCAALATIRAQGMAVLVVEEDVVCARRAADRLHCMLKGRVTLSGAVAELSRDQISRACFGH